MKKIYTTFFLIVFVMSFNANAQVNYLFNSFQSVYTPLENGIHPALDNPTPVGYYEEDEGFANQVPIGFTFQFNNTDYTHLNINVNGFVTFGEGFTPDVNDRYNINNLMTGPMQENVRPLIAPFWDDLWLQNTRCLSYATKGVAPNRQFIVQWDSASWNYNMLEPAISFQMILFEGSNKVQFTYKALAGNMGTGNASVGIATCSMCTGSFLSVNSIDENARLSGVKEFNNISSKPKTGTVIEFEPGKCAMPDNAMVNTYNNKEVSLSWNTLSNTAEYDYAITTSHLQPIAYNTSSSPAATFNNLDAGVQYYIHVRTSNTNGKSGWVSVPVKTASLTSLPYTEKFETVVAPAIPENIHIANPTGGSSWQTISLPNSPENKKAISLKGDNTNNADAWFMLPGMELNGGLTYRLQFDYRASDTLGGNQKIEIKIGKMMSNSMMGWQTIYKNIKINQTRFKDTALLFAAPTNDIYFIAFRCVSEKNNSAVWIDNIAVNKIQSLPVKLIAFNGVREFYSNKISWQTTAEMNNSHFILERSIDGKNFINITTIPSKATNGTSTTPINYTISDFSSNMVNYYRLKIVDKSRNEFDGQNIIRIADQLPFKITAFKTYPNPTTNILNIVLYAQQQTKGLLQISNNVGNIILTIPVEIYNGDNILKADVSKLTNGIYYAKIIGSNGEKTIVKKFIKQ
ncbi:MAG: T9SS type A sorting domain-containing protein [Chitinophagaceae bacterium]|nr:T9SS type A sorting domain-containing protein [Chitinophagaceae bacterium]MCW5904468.1 T9SS type A sorting domain-containing protein [Chitinophagaceae bacterium]